MFASPDIEQEMVQRLNALPVPGGLVVMYERSTGTLAMAVARKDSVDAEPLLLGWALHGPVSEDEAQEEADAMSARYGYQAAPITIN